MAFQDLTGHKFVKLFVESRAENARDGSARWNCVCDCGERRTIHGTGLRAGRHKSCGCSSPRFKPNDPANAGYSNLREYRIWAGMLKRCSDGKRKKSHLYFRKGIRVCARWHVFENFIADMGACPPGFTIERKDGNAGYAPSNCIWASRMTQANNTTRNVWLEWKGERRTIAQWARDLGIKPNTIVCRVRRGWSVERALERVVKIKWQGE